VPKKEGRLARLIALLLLLAFPTGLSAQDSTLGEIVQRVLSSQLVSGGRRDTLVWEASDSTTLVILREAELPPNYSLRARPENDIQCPGGTDRRKALLQQPVGYTVSVEVRSDSVGRSLLEVRVSCTFTYLGGAHGFAEGGRWVVTRRGGRWILGEQLEHWIT